VVPADPPATVSLETERASLDASWRSVDKEKKKMSMALQVRLPRLYKRHHASSALVTVPYPQRRFLSQRFARQAVRSDHTTCNMNWCTMKYLLDCMSGVRLIRHATPYHATRDSAMRFGCTRASFPHHART
jgi:hypothetical protein